MRNYCSAVLLLLNKTTARSLFCDLAVVFAFSFNEYHGSFNFGITYLRYHSDSQIALNSKKK